MFPYILYGQAKNLYSSCFTQSNVCLVSIHVFVQFIWEGQIWSKFDQICNLIWRKELVTTNNFSQTKYKRKKWNPL